MYREVTPGIRRLLILAGALVALAGIQLFVFSEQTDRYFAWTINPPLTAAFLGASYWASVVFEVTAARQRLWANARIAVPTVFIFTTLTLIVTLIHIENFHLGAEFEIRTRIVTWVWILIYVTVPVALGALWWIQSRVPGGDPPRAIPLPGGLRAVGAIQAVVLLGVGLALLVAPVAVGEAWPWEVTALTGRAIGAWVFSLGVAAAHALWENCARRLRPPGWAYIAFALLQAWALARFPGDMNWSSPGGIAYLVFLASTLGVGVATLRLGRES